MSVASAKAAKKPSPDPRYDWTRVAKTVLVSRALDALEESKLVPAKKVLYQFSARGHDMAQVLLGTLLDDRARRHLRLLSVAAHPAFARRRSRRCALFEHDAVGRLFGRPRHRRGVQLPQCERTIGACPCAAAWARNITPTAGWAQAIEYRRAVLREPGWDRAIAVALGGDASCATGGFWSALNIATTLKLPMLFYVEDNGYGISVPSTFQTPGADIAANLASFKNLRVRSGDGADPAEAARLFA